jgi:hypothetical protein
LAPAVPEEDAKGYFDLAGGASWEFMVVATQVHDEMRPVIPAVTHVDGTARPQLVSRRTNPRFWQVLRDFGRMTGVPVLLNTSFNNEAEPIVQTVDDAIVAFLTMDLDALVVGPYLVRKEDLSSGALSSFQLDLPPTVELCALRGGSAAGPVRSYTLRHNLTGGRKTTVSEVLGETLLAARLPCAVGEVMDHAQPGDCLAEIIDLWGGRFVSLRPSSP